MAVVLLQEAPPAPRTVDAGIRDSSLRHANNRISAIRLNVAVTPDLSLQLYAQPFVASGDYGGFKEFARPRSFDFTRYGTDGRSTVALDESTNLYTADADGEGPVATFFSLQTSC